MRFLLFLFSFIQLLSLPSCIVHAPKYSTIEKVLTLKQGMTKDEVSQVLGISPYNLVSVNDTGETVLLYKYRVANRAMVPFFLKPTNGKTIRGKYVNLLVTYDAEGKVKSMETCVDCDETIIEEKRIDPDKIVTLITVTLPAVMIYLGLQTSP